MQPPPLNERTLEHNGKTYRAKPVMLMFFYIQQSFDRGEQQPAVKLHQAMQAAMRFYHSDEEIMDLMGELTVPEVMNFLTPAPEGETEEDLENFTPMPEVSELNDSFLTSGRPTGDVE